MAKKTVKKQIKKPSAGERRATEQVAKLEAELSTLTSQVASEKQNVEYYKKQSEANATAYRTADGNRYTAEQATNSANATIRTRDAQIVALQGQVSTLTNQVTQFKSQAETNGQILNRLLPTADDKSAAAKEEKPASMGYPMFMPSNGKSHF